jgi:hypothetical protein
MGTRKEIPWTVGGAHVLICFQPSLRLTFALVFSYDLQQLHNMGFANTLQNIQALQATGGNLNSAIETLVNGWA